MSSKRIFGSPDYLPSLNSKLLSQAINMTYAASGSTGIQVADNDNISIYKVKYIIRKYIESIVIHVRRYIATKQIRRIP